MIWVDKAMGGTLHDLEHLPRWWLKEQPFCNLSRRSETIIHEREVLRRARLRSYRHRVDLEQRCLLVEGTRRHGAGSRDSNGVGA